MSDGHRSSSLFENVTNMKSVHSPVHPGKILQEYLGSHSVSEVAKVLGVHRTTLARVLSGNTGISLDLSIRLGMALGTAPDFWVDLQMKYDLYQSLQQKRPNIRRLGKEPIKDRSVRALKGMFVPPKGRNVSIEDMRIGSDRHHPT
jgi:addiction module HigA family antidote